MNSIGPKFLSKDIDIEKVDEEEISDVDASEEEDYIPVRRPASNVE